MLISRVTIKANNIAGVKVSMVKPVVVKDADDLECG